MTTIKNAKTLPKVYYGLHMCEGIAEYKEPQVNDGSPYRIMIGEQALKNMDPSFAGRPVYVRHVEEVNLEKIQDEADGYVMESFFNTKDGKHWAKFIVVSDRGHEAIRSGWKLSNAYLPKQMSGGGLWHGVEYSKEVTNGEYEHLAIVPNPRYEESIILTPEEFKTYNSEKELELKALANSKGEMSMFNFFKKSKVENASELESMSVTLPKSKKEMTLTQVINGMDEYELKMKEPMQMANGEHHVMVGDEKMTVNELVAKHMNMMAKEKENEDESDKDAKKDEAKGEGELEPKNDDDEEAKKKALELAEHEDKEMKEKKAKKENDEQEGKESGDKSEEKMDAKKKNAYFKALKDAPMTPIKDSVVLELSQDKVARGKTRYGS